MTGTEWLVVVEAQTRVWEEFGETMEKDFQLAPRIFWQTFRLCRKGKQGPSQVVLDLGGELLTLTEYIVGQWKEHLEDLLNPASMSSIEEAESEDLGEDSSINLAKVVKGIKNLASYCVPVSLVTEGIVGV